MKNRRDIIQSIAGITAPVARDELDGGFSLSDTAELREQEQRLKRSLDVLNKTAGELGELLKFFDRENQCVNDTYGIDQEYFIIDRGWYNERTDLMFTGRTLVGRPQPGDRLPENHCAGLRDRVSGYMRDVCAAADNSNFKFGYPADGQEFTDVASGPYVFGSSGTIRDNLQLMKIMKQVALRNNLVCLLHEKPFTGVSGNGKRVRWMLPVDNVNAFAIPDEDDTTHQLETELFFLTCAASVVHAVYRHGDLLCAAVASAGNESRLDADEAPSAVMSVSLGEQLSKIFAAIETYGKAEKGKKRDFADIGAGILSGSAYYYGNDASPVVIAGDAFKFGMLGASMDASIFVTVINTITADSMAMICDRIKKELAKSKGDKRAVVAAGANDVGAGNQKGEADRNKQETIAATMNVLAAVIKESKPILFEGDIGSIEWAKEARARGLPGAAPTHEALKAFVAPKAIELFKRHAVFSESELMALYDARLNQYCKALDVEIKTLTDMVNTQVLPSAYNYQADIASGLEVLRVLADDMTIEMTDGALEDRKEMFEKLTADIYHARKNLKELTAMADKAIGMEAGERAAYLFKEVKPQMDNIKKRVDALEGSMPDEMWPLPKYRDMLFIV